jgi:hypothetical protein
MSSSSSSSSSGGFGAIGLLGVVFVTLKLFGITEVATWSWWWVTAPFWGGLALLAVIGLVFGLAWLVLEVIERMQRKKLRR